MKKMQIKYQNRESNDYRFTVDLNNSEDVQHLNNLKKFVSAHNKRYKHLQLRVALKGRLGKDNPNAVKYRGKGWNAYQTIRKADAKHFDVYVYKR
jgi:hypothetical protein